LKHKTRKDTRLKFYESIAVPMLIYGSEAWVLSKREESKIQSSDMLFLRSVKVCSRIDRIKNYTTGTKYIYIKGQNKR
jgi:hypothetical protein